MIFIENSYIYFLFLFVSSLFEMSSLLVVTSILYCYRELFYFWSGNHRIYEIVQQGFYELRIDMADFNSESRYAVYKRFYIGDETTGYRLHVEDYEGTAGNFLCLFLCLWINNISINYIIIAISFKTHFTSLYWESF